MTDFGRKIILSLECRRVILDTLHGVEQSERLLQLHRKGVETLSIIERQEFALIYERARMWHIIDERTA